MYAEHTINQDFSDGGCFLVPHREKFDPFCKMVNYRENVHITAGGGRVRSRDIDP